MEDIHKIREILHILIAIPTVIVLMAIWWKYHFNIRKLLPRNNEIDYAYY